MSSPPGALGIDPVEDPARHRAPRRLEMAALCCMVVLLSIPSPGEASGKSVFGWIEEGLVLPEHTAVKMKLDTGAHTSSMQATNLERFERGGKPWVRFDVEVMDIDTGDLVSSRFERPILRAVAVKGAGGVDHRVVASMSICIGTVRYEGEFTLRNREGMLYPVLLGREAIEHIGLVDVTRTFTIEPSCP